MVHRSILAAVALLLVLVLTSLAQQQVSPVPRGQPARSPQAAAEKPGAIKGCVTAADTSAGLRRARVMLSVSESRSSSPWQGGQLSGVVRKEEGGEVLRGATVVLFAADPERQSKSRFIKTVQTDQQGSFVAQGRVPGKHVVCALLNHEAGAETDVSYPKEIEKLGRRVELAAGAAKTENLVAAAGSGRALCGVIIRSLVAANSRGFLS